tara:strand:+ start:816 stop:956 length:141 start_codon:yes stop_codon:yes gene_type:complete
MKIPLHPHLRLENLYKKIVLNKGVIKKEDLNELRLIIIFINENLNH